MQYEPTSDPTRATVPRAAGGASGLSPRFQSHMSVSNDLQWWDFYDEHECCSSLRNFPLADRTFSSPDLHYAKS